MTNHHQRFPIQVRISRRKKDGSYGEERVWSQHRKNDDNALRAYKEAVRDYPDSRVVVFDAVAGGCLYSYEPGPSN